MFGYANALALIDDPGYSRGWFLVNGGPYNSNLPSLNVYHLFKEYIGATKNYLYYNNTLVAQNQNGRSSPSVIRLSHWYTGYAYIDYIYVAKFAEPEPSYSSWGEEVLITLAKTENNPGLSCKDVLVRGDSLGNGIYWIDPDGEGVSSAFKAYCDMVTDGGGWTLVAVSSGVTDWGAVEYSPDSVFNLQRGKYSDAMINTLVTPGTTTRNVMFKCNTKTNYFIAEL
ncbi:MAG: hypothetical protein BWY21_02325 [Parcubacteria group bacterium ADurb.Bin216]|nr:MAG: hypothetical protein BWY21_02325 [Parcubacteria group bacterium ADurb.Bin216]